MRRWCARGAGLLAVLAGACSTYESQPDDAGAPDAGEASSDAGSDGPAPSPLRPPSARYAYTATGSDFLKILETEPLVTDIPPTIYGTLSVPGDGWTFSLAITPRHDATWSFQTKGLELDETGSSEKLTWLVAGTPYENVTALACTPPFVLVPASRDLSSSSARSCTGKNSNDGSDVVTTGAVTLVGREVVTVDGEPIPALHVFEDTTIATGTTKGTEKREWWLAESDGLPLQGKIDINTTASTILGAVIYKENATWKLVSRAPVTTEPDASADAPDGG